MTNPTLLVTHTVPPETAEELLDALATEIPDAEVLSADSPLWDLSNVLLTPHMAGSTPEKDDRWAEIIGENYRRFGTDEPYVNRIL